MYAPAWAVSFASAVSLPFGSEPILSCQICSCQHFFEWMYTRIQNQSCGLPCPAGPDIAMRRQGIHLAPSRPLLEAVTDLLWRLSHSQVVLHVAAVPLVSLHDHAQGKVLRQRVGGRPARLLEGSAPAEEVGPCTPRHPSDQHLPLCALRLIHAPSCHALGMRFGLIDRPTPV